MVCLSVGAMAVIAPLVWGCLYINAKRRQRGEGGGGGGGGNGGGRRDMEGDETSVFGSFSAVANGSNGENGGGRRLSSQYESISDVSPRV